MQNLINYFEKSKRQKGRKQREKMAWRCFEPFKGSYALFHKVNTGFRNRAKLVRFWALPAFVDGQKIDVTVNRVNCFAKIDVESAEKLLSALLGKKKNRGRIIRAIAPRLLDFPLY